MDVDEGFTAYFTGTPSTVPHGLSALPPTHTSHRTSSRTCWRRRVVPRVSCGQHRRYARRTVISSTSTEDLKVLWAALQNLPLGRSRASFVGGSPTPR